VMNQKNNCSGFTLVEGLFAIVLMTIVIAAVGSSFQYAASMNAFAQDKIAAANDAEKTMEEVRRVANSSGLAATSTASTWTTWISAQTFSGLPDESVAVTFPAGTAGDPLQVLVTVTWSEKSATRAFKLYSLVTKRT